jgi:hypothetical protein
MTSMAAILGFPPAMGEVRQAVVARFAETFSLTEASVLSGAVW